jgi:transcriptional regulator with XRE-family HTH domain
MEQTTTTRKGRPIKSEIGALISSKGFTISETANQIGMSQSRLSHLLSKPHKIKAIDLYHLSYVLGVETSDIFKLLIADYKANTQVPDNQAVTKTA